MENSGNNKLSTLFNKESLSSQHDERKNFSPKMFLYSVTKIILISSLVSFGMIKYFGKLEIKKYIDTNPRVIITSIENMYKNERDKSQQESLKKVPEIASKLVSNSALPYIGNKNGSKVIIEFFDYSCGYCQKQANDILKLISQDNDIKVILVDFPIFSADSLLASQVGIEIFNEDISKFQKYYVAISENKGQLTKKSILSLLNQIGVKNPSKLIDYVGKSDTIKSVIEFNYEQARALALQGTPALIVNNKLLPGYSDINAILSALNNK